MIRVLADMVLTQTADPPGWAEIIGQLVAGIGGPATALILLVLGREYIQSKKRGQGSNKTDEAPRGPASFLTEKVADLDRHAKEGFRETLGGLSALSHGVDKLSEQTLRLDRVWAEELRDIRHEIEKLPEQIELRIQAAQSRER